MIVLLTSDGDISTDLVINWLNYFSYPYKRINSIDLLRKSASITINGSQVFFTVANEEIDTHSVGVVWFRKFGFFKYSDFHHEASKVVEKDILDLISKEFTALLDGVISIFREKKWLTHPYAVNINKIDALLLAKQCGLAIPETYVINEKEDLSDIVSSGLISKSIKDSFMLLKDNIHYAMYTTEIKKEDLIEIPDRFFNSLLQHKVEKQYELRIFYLLGRCYTMAIFSQSDKQTEIDFRRYNWNQPNRTVPYKLPPEVSKAVVKLIKKLGLNCASIDMIKSTDGKYYFLEVNSTGQFGMVDFPCNYALHRKVAEALISLDQKK